MEPRGTPLGWIDSHSTLRANVTWASLPKRFCLGEIYFAVSEDDDVVSEIDSTVSEIDFAVLWNWLCRGEIDFAVAKLILPWWNWFCRREIDFAVSKKMLPWQLCVTATSKMFTLFPSRHNGVPRSRYTNKAFWYRALEIPATHFDGYLKFGKTHRPKTWRSVSVIYLL